MISILKIGDTIYENFEEKTFIATKTDEQGNPVEFKEVYQIPTDVNELKQVAIDTVKWQAGFKLKETDWVVTKCIELGLNPAEEYPQIIQQRQAIRNWSNQKEAEINSANTFEELLEIIKDLKLHV